MLLNNGLVTKAGKRKKTYVPYKILNCIPIYSAFWLALWNLSITKFGEHQ